MLLNLLFFMNSYQSADLLVIFASTSCRSLLAGFAADGSTFRQHLVIPKHKVLLEIAEDRLAYQARRIRADDRYIVYLQQRHRRAIIRWARYLLDYASSTSNYAGYAVPFPAETDSDEG